MPTPGNIRVMLGLGVWTEWEGPGSLQGLALADLQRCLPTQTIPWSCNSVRTEPWLQFMEVFLCRGCPAQSGFLGTLHLAGTMCLLLFVITIIPQ